MQIILNNSSMVPIYEQLMAQIKAAVIDGSLKSGAALPSVRNLAAELKISALTVKKAYDKLEEEGFVVTVHGKGSFIAERNLHLLEETRKYEAEKTLEEGIAKALMSGLSKQEVRELIEILLEEQK